jgi:(2S)-methylsuccinyl-CoA dehydrogenase
MVSSGFMPRLEPCTVSMQSKTLLDNSAAGLAAAEALLAKARANLAARIGNDAARLDAEQIAAHGLAWMATYVAALRQLRAWAARLDEAGEFAEPQRLILAVGFGEYLAQLGGGIAMGQGEIARPQDLGLADDDLAPLRGNPLIAGLAEARARFGALLGDGMPTGGDSLGDDTLELIRDQVRRFAERAVAPYAHDWHRQDKFIPIEVIEELSDIGVFGVTLPEEYGGLGLGKLAMCIVSEELSRAYIGVGSLGTRSEIAGELIRINGTPQQKLGWLPGIASGAVMPTAVFTVPTSPICRPAP